MINKTSDEKKTEKLFKKYKSIIIGKMGNQETTDVELDEIGTYLFGKQFIGVYAQDTIPLGKTGYLIANTDISNQPGTHWVAIVITAKNIYVYDSFGRPASKLLKVLSKNAKEKKINIVNSDLSDKEQRDSSAICGQLCLSFLCVVKHLGIRSALLI